MTLQLVLGGSDGVLIVTDTKQVTLPRSQPWSEGYKRPIRSYQQGVEKVLFDETKTVACLCSGSDSVHKIGKLVADDAQSHWDTSGEAIRTLCVEQWRKLPNEDRSLSSRYRNTIVILNCKRQEVFKVLFTLEDGGLDKIEHRPPQRLVVLCGDEANPAGLIVERYYPSVTPPVERLLFLAAYFITTGEDMNPAGVGGIAMYFSKDGQPFEEVSPDVVASLWDKSKKLSSRTQKHLLKES